MTKVVWEAYPQRAGLDEPAPGYLLSDDPFQIAERLADVGFETGHLAGARWTRSDDRYVYTATVVESEAPHADTAAEINAYLKATEMQQDARRVLFAFVIHQECEEGRVTRDEALRVAGSTEALEALIYLHGRAADIGVDEIMHSGFDALALLYAERTLGLRSEEE
ncbi:hypothetical protein [Nocardia mexicana]|uniref:Uncharacterized protein n=1 Tax=Nocardia mexicana TaxID=279262 RepID=A0A370HCM7_9NOCA|nr:hypothetical protein [Nocardia mexicana]RDI54145.1 hypothetical protein DFR68_102269 [Nocardia mexicana]